MASDHLGRHGEVMSHSFPTERLLALLRLEGFEKYNLIVKEVRGHYITHVGAKDFPQVITGPEQQDNPFGSHPDTVVPSRLIEGTIVTIHSRPWLVHENHVWTEFGCNHNLLILKAVIANTKDPQFSVPAIKPGDQFTLPSSVAELTICNLFDKAYDAVDKSHRWGPFQGQYKITDKHDLLERLIEFGLAEPHWLVPIPNVPLLTQGLFSSVLFEVRATDPEIEVGIAHLIQEAKLAMHVFRGVPVSELSVEQILRTALATAFRALAHKAKQEKLHLQYDEVKRFIFVLEQSGFITDISL